MRERLVTAGQRPAAAAAAALPWIVLTFVVVAGLLAAPAHAASTFTVSAFDDPVGATCNGTVCSSLRAALEAADSASGSTIQLGSGTYTVSQGELVATTDVAIVGAGSSLTTIQATGAGRVLFASSTSAEVDVTGVTITGGNLTGTAGSGPGVAGQQVLGGGILNYGTMTLTDVVVTGNSATGGTGGPGGSGTGGAGGEADGGAIATGDGSHSNTLKLVSSAVTGNTTTGGAGGFSFSVAAGAGGFASGAIHAAFSTVDVEGSTVSGNHVTGGAGGTGSNPSATAGVGGPASAALSAAGSSVTLTDSTVAGNVVTGGGGGVGGSGPKGGAGGGASGGGIRTEVLTARSSTIAGNTATGGAGGDSDSSTGGQGGAAAGGGVDADDGGNHVFVDSTIAGNTAAGGAPGASASGVPAKSGAAGGGYAGSSGIMPLEVTFASTTIDGNVADGGADIDTSDANVTIGSTIVAGGHTATGTASNCSIALTPHDFFTDRGGNLDDSSPSQCGLSTAAGDLVGADPALLALADNGGPTHTMALGDSSPAIGAGGACKDPTDGAALTVDQRGLPRPAVCDIGAFQLEPPGAGGAPAVSGTPAPGQALSCSQGAWSGDRLSFAYQWLRDGGAIAGATGASYAVTTGDAGHALSCQVTASNVRGAASQVSAPVAVPAAGGGGGGGGGGGTASPFVLSGLSESHRVWAEGTKLPQISRARRHPVGTVFTFKLSAPGTVRLDFLRAVPGRRVAHKCSRVTARDRSKPRCTRLVAAGGRSFAAHSGVNRIAFQGPISAGHRLSLGTYTLSVTATSATGKTLPAQTLHFKIVRR